MVIEELSKDGHLKVHYDPPESDPNFGEDGEAIEWDGSSQEFKARVPEFLEELHRAAARKLPRGTVYELRGMIPTNAGLHHGVAWYHVDRMADWPVTGAVPFPGEFNPLGGYTKLGVFRTP